MKFTINTCDRCGKIIHEFHDYSIKCFIDEIDKGGYVYCKSCFDYMTDLFNKNTEKEYGDRTKRLEDFLGEYNKRFGKDE